MKSTTTTPALVDPTRPVPLEVEVHPDDVVELLGEAADEQRLVVAGLVAERVARKWGYRLVEIDRVEPQDEALHVDGWAVAAGTGGGPA